MGIGGSDGKASTSNAGDPGSIPGLGRSPGEGNGNPLQCSCLENPMDRGAWRATVHGVAKSRTRLSDFTFTCHFHLLTPRTDLVLQYFREWCTPLRETRKYEQQTCYIFFHVFLNFLLLGTDLYRAFCFVLPMCVFLFSCLGSLIRSTISCKGYIHAPILC